MQIMVDIEGIDWNTIPLAPVAQLDRALPSEGRGHRFESCRVRHSFPQYIQTVTRLGFQSDLRKMQF